MMISWNNWRIEICKEIAASPEIVWKTITDTHLWPAWGPSVSSVDCSDRYIQAGTSGRVKTGIGLWLPFTITLFKPTESWSWKIGSIEATGHQLMSKKDTSCTLCFDMVWWAAAYLPVCWLALKRVDTIVSSTK